MMDLLWLSRRLDCEISEISAYLASCSVISLGTFTTMTSLNSVNLVAVPQYVWPLLGQHSLQKVINYQQNPNANNRCNVCQCVTVGRIIQLNLCLTTVRLCSMLGNFFKYLFLSKFSKNSLFTPIFFADI